jgi:hypothetical protein
MYSLIIQMAENNLILYWIMKNNLNFIWIIILLPKVNYVTLNNWDIK